MSYTAMREVRWHRILDRRFCLGGLHLLILGLVGRMGEAPDVKRKVSPAAAMTNVPMLNLRGLELIGFNWEREKWVLFEFQ